jgi:hypothetical protein
VVLYARIVIVKHESQESDDIDIEPLCVLRLNVGLLTSSIDVDLRSFMPRKCKPIFQKYEVSNIEVREDCHGRQRAMG